MRIASRLRKILHLDLRRIALDERDATSEVQLWPPPAIPCSIVRIDLLLADARAALPPRPTPAELPALVAGGALVVDIRPVEQRERDGELPGAVVIDRNVLEWRLDPTSPDRVPGAEDPDRQIVIVCNEGYASSLAAATLQQLGLRGATDLDGGYQALLRHAGRRSGS
jgi:rhodanese-related sulfurtransferase